MCLREGCLSEPTTEQETWLRSRCREAGCTPLQTDILVERQIAGKAPARIYHEIKGACRDGIAIRQLHDVVDVLEKAERKVAKLPECRGAAAQFARDLVHCAADRRCNDERPPDMRGVTPADAAKGIHAGPIVIGDDLLPLAPEDAVRVYRWSEQRPQVFQHRA